MSAIGSSFVGSIGSPIEFKLLRSIRNSSVVVIGVKVTGSFMSYEL